MLNRKWEGCPTLDGEYLGHPALSIQYPFFAIEAWAGVPVLQYLSMGWHIHILLFKHRPIYSRVARMEYRWEGPIGYSI
jgi:hypothetical protein